MTRFIEFGDMVINVAHIVSAAHQSDGSVRIKLDDGDVYVDYVESPAWWDELWGAFDVVRTMPGTGYKIESSNHGGLEPVELLAITADGAIRPMHCNPEDGDFSFYPDCVPIYKDSDAGCK